MLGCFQMNQIALRIPAAIFFPAPPATRLLECYDGPHYFEKPSFHTSKTIGKMAAK